MILCYVDGPWAYFTDRALSEQWGDDWNDAPYIHNAGSPYQHHGETIRRVAVSGISVPDRTCDLSVQAINGGAAPWLSNRDPYSSTDTPVDIYAGVSLEEFVLLVEKAGGTVYLPRDRSFDPDASQLARAGALGEAIEALRRMVPAPAPGGKGKEGA